jgi:hypothetical protein
MSTPARRLCHFGLVAVTILLVLFALFEAWLVLGLAFSGHAVGLDFNIYLAHARTWLAGGNFYEAHQLTGSPYEIVDGDALYPPSILYLLLPATLLPAALWWLIPASIVGYALWRHRPQLWGWTYIALAFCWPRTWQAIIFGNPVIWVVAAIGAGTLWGWPYLGAFLKPTFGIFGLLGARDRRWWIAFGVAALVALPLLDLWREYVVVLSNARLGAWLAPDYLWGELPLVALPLVIRLARSPVRAEPSPSVSRQPALEAQPQIA